MPEKSLIISILALSHCIVWGQNLNGNPVLASPISSFGSLSGGYGEIRTDHFHSGIDIRTKGKTGLRVYATDEGWIARIKVSPIGFGKTLYIQHPNGYTTVYAHLTSSPNR
jgi:murein DD-endopeptidase MepM/ murein hydrolase activator NlpD